MKRAKGKVEMKRKKARKLLFSILFVLILIIGLGVSLAYNLNRVNQMAEKNDRYALIDKNNITMVYEDKLALEIPNEISLNKEITVKKLVNSKNYKQLLENLNEVLPEKVQSYKIVRYTKPDLAVKKIQIIPNYTIGDKKYILTTETQEVFDNFYTGKTKRETNLVVDILNANGIIGYARETGDKLKTKLGISYTAANYEKNTNYSLIRINEIDQEKLEDILVTLNEKYFRIKKDDEIPTLANVVVVLGREQSIPMRIDVIGGNRIAKDLTKDLKRAGYKNVILRDSTKNIERNIIEYNREDYYTALKISKRFNIRGMEENNKLKNKINILIK